MYNILELIDNPGITRLWASFLYRRAVTDLDKSRWNTCSLRTSNINKKIFKTRVNDYFCTYMLLEFSNYKMQK